MPDSVPTCHRHTIGGPHLTGNHSSMRTRNCCCVCDGGSGACTAVSQQEGHGFDSRMTCCWLWGASPPQTAQCSGGLSPGPFCVEIACSPRVHKGFPPLRTPTEKTCKTTEHMSIPDQRWTAHFTWSPGATSCPLLLGGP